MAETTQQKISDSQIELLAEAFERKYSLRMAAKVAGVSKRTAQLWRSYAADSLPMDCGCGRPRTHHGMCGYRRETFLISEGAMKLQKAISGARGRR